jgi:type IV pilus assembly protein PilA
MKQCPQCRKNLSDSVTTCPFCGQVVAGVPPGPGVRPAGARRGSDDEDTLNPLRLLLLCLRPGGRFSRSQFALVYLGSIAVFWSAVLGIGFGAGLLGASEDSVGLLAGLAVLAFLPVILATFIGGGIRRWHDLGKPGAYVLLGFVPCVGVVAILYLLLAPGRPDADAPSGSTPVLVVVAAVLVVGVIGMGIVAAIAIPSLLRARVAANEAATIGDIRTVISAQAAYQESNGGFFEGNIECLARPSVGCAPGLPADVLPFISPALASREPRNGYQRRFEPGRMMAVDAALSSQTSVASYAYVAVPVAPGQTGVRSFCGDPSGVLCFRSDGADIPATGGECPLASGGCEVLQ